MTTLTRHGLFLKKRIEWINLAFNQLDRIISCDHDSELENLNVSFEDYEDAVSRIRERMLNCKRCRKDYQSLFLRSFLSNCYSHTEDGELIESIKNFILAMTVCDEFVRDDETHILRIIRDFAIKSLSDYGEAADAAEIDSVTDSVTDSVD